MTLAPAEVVYRKAGPADRESILAVSALFPDDWIPYAIDEALTRERGGFFVAEVGGKVAAVAAARISGDAAWLEAMRVDPAYQGRGLATALTVHILAACARWGCRKARLSTAETNAPVHHFIGRKLGFSALGRYIFSAEETDLDPLGTNRPAAQAAVRPGTLDDIEAVCRFVSDRAREGYLRPAGLLASFGDPWRLVEFSPSEVARYAEAGGCLVHRPAREGGDAGSAEIDGVALYALVPEDPFEAGPAGPGARPAAAPTWACLVYLEGCRPFGHQGPHCGCGRRPASDRDGPAADLEPAENPVG